MRSGLLAGHKAEPVQGVFEVPGVDFALLGVWSLNPDEVPVLEPAKPALNRASVDTEFLCETAVPLPAGVRAEGTEVAVKVLHAAGDLFGVELSHPEGHVVLGLVF